MLTHWFQTRGVTIPALDLDPESDFSFFVIQDLESDPVEEES